MGDIQFSTLTFFKMSASRSDLLRLAHGVVVTETCSPVSQGTGCKKIKMDATGKFAT